MRVLLLSDIHSNLEALEACLATTPEYDMVVNLGDIVGYCASPNEVIDRARALGNIFVRGNHDRAASGLMELEDFNPIAAAAATWTHDHLTPEHLQWLRSLPQGPIHLPELEDAQFVHGSPLDEDEYLLSPRDAIEPLMLSSRPLTFFGHTHLQGSFAVNGTQLDESHPVYSTVGQLERSEFAIQEGRRYLINPGSVGQPRDGDWRAAFAVYDSVARAVTFYRVPYNLKAAQSRILEANLPQRLATRLAAGR